MGKVKEEIINRAEVVAEGGTYPDDNYPGGHDSALVETAPSTFTMNVVAPDKILESAKKVAEALSPLIRDNPMTVNVNGKQYPKVEVWLTLAMMHGVTPRTVWTKRITDDAGEFVGYDSCTEVVRLSDGMVIGRAEASVTTSERNWSDRDEYALKSMSQTRSTSQALRRIFAYIVTLTGIETSPAEEMDFAVATPKQKPELPDSLKTKPKQAAKTKAAQAAQTDKVCKKCGAALKLETRGKYRGFFCPDAPYGDKSHSVEWVK